MNLLESLQCAASFFELGWDTDPDIYEDEQTDAYQEIIQQIRRETGVFKRNTYIEAIKDRENELPFESNPDWERDVKQDR